MVSSEYTIFYSVTRKGRLFPKSTQVKSVLFGRYFKKSSKDAWSGAIEDFLKNTDILVRTECSRTHQKRRQRSSRGWRCKPRGAAMTLLLSKFTSVIIHPLTRIHPKMSSENLTVFIFYSFYFSDRGADGADHLQHWQHYYYSTRYLNIDTTSRDRKYQN